MFIMRGEEKKVERGKKKGKLGKPTGCTFPRTYIGDV